MLDKNTKLIVGERILPIDPYLVAELFTEMDSEQQAIFFNHVAEIAQTWSWGDMSMQLQYVTDEDGLTLAGRRAMQKIGDYSHWGLSPKASEIKV